MRKPVFFSLLGVVLAAGIGITLFTDGKDEAKDTGKGLLESRIPENITKGTRLEYTQAGSFFIFY
ncbi:hypothetical protein [Bacillus salipaludis]|uniref:Uncharacterized protein n=1 Tax=Bacillus salipaludis TaxID=2547811 RepID=A0ABW8RK30_9BACI